MSREGLNGIKPVHIDLGKNASPKTEQSPGIFPGFTSEEMRNLDSRILNHLPPWADNLQDPVFQNMPEDLIARLKDAATPHWDASTRQSLVNALEKRWDDLNDEGE